MKKSRLLELLKALDSVDLRRLEDMVYSPYFNKDKKVKLLFGLLKPFWPSYDNPQLTRQWIFEQLYEGRKKINASLSITMSKLQGLIKEHMVQKKLQERPYYKRHLLLQSLLDCNQLAYFKSQHKETTDLLENKGRFDIETYHEKYLLEQDFRAYIFKKKGRNDHTQLIPVIRTLDTYYLSRKLNLSCELLNLQEIIRMEYDPVLLGHLDEIITHPFYKENSFIQFYHSVLQIFKDRNDRVGFDHLVTLLKQPIAQGLSKRELNDVYTHAINFCIDKLNLGGELVYRKTLFDLYLSLIENDLLYKGVYLDLGRFKNIVTLACQLDKTDLVKDLIISLKQAIEPKYREEAVHYFFAVIFFYEKDYESALDHLLDVREFMDVFFELNAKSYLLRCYYELNKSQAFLFLSESFGAHLRRNKKVKTSKTYGNFNKLAYQLYKMKEGFSKRTPEKMKEKIATTNPLMHRAWLLEKCMELKKKVRY